MFERLKRKAAKFQNLNQDKLMDEVLAIPVLDAQIVDLNQKQLYEQGLQADGSPTGEYSAKTKLYKYFYGDARGIPGRADHMTGLDTGETYDSMAVKSLPEGIVITADDRNDFFKTYEPKGLGLTEGSKKEILPEVRESLIHKIRKAIS